jgi:hypothetical protein
MPENIIKRLPAVGLCSGFGQWHSPNNKKEPLNYVKVSMPKIQYMLSHPLSVEKSKAQWVIFSTLPSRIHSEQRENGNFYALWADIDDTDGLPFEDIVDRACGCLLDFFAYTSKSAVAERQKARIILPLSGPVNGKKFVILQKILNDRLSCEGIRPDRATERAGQVCYLPNRGSLYQHHVEAFNGPMRTDAWDEYVSIEEKILKSEEEQSKIAVEQSRIKAKKRMESGCQSPIDAFNDEYDLERALIGYGYLKRGTRFLSPNSEGGVAGVVIMPDGKKWVSSHGSDSGIGRPTSNGTMGSAFDLFVYYDHGGDINRAIKAAGEMFNLKRS